MLCVLMKILSHASAKKKTKGRNGQILHYYGSFLKDIMAVKRLINNLALAGEKRATTLKYKTKMVTTFLSVSSPTEHHQWNLNVCATTTLKRFRKTLTRCKLRGVSPRIRPAAFSWQSSHKITSSWELAFTARLTCKRLLRFMG